MSAPDPDPYAATMVQSPSSRMPSWVSRRVGNWTIRTTAGVISLIVTLWVGAAIERFAKAQEPTAEIVATAMAREREDRERGDHLIAERLKELIDDSKVDNATMMELSKGQAAIRADVENLRDMMYGRTSRRR